MSGPRERLRFNSVIAASTVIAKLQSIVVLLPSLPFHRLLGSPGLAKLTPGSPALPGVPTQLGSFL